MKNQKSKSKNQNYISEFKNFAFWFVILIFDICILNFPVYAKEITILYTGQTHAMLYPCSCPKEPDGGVSRRATLIKELRKNNPDTLLLDSGSFFAGGLRDEYSQNTELDRARTAVNLKAMELMRYDALTIGDDEFNFGREFLEENINHTKIPFLSSNIKFNKAKIKVLPYIIKSLSGLKIGITGVTAPSVRQKAGELQFVEPKLAVKQVVKDLKNEGANLIILLSSLGEGEGLDLIKEIPEIDILIAGNSRAKEEALTKVGSTLILQPSWQGRRLGKLSLTVTAKQITNYKAEELRLSDDQGDSQEILAILPRCFADADCKKSGLIGLCQKPGTFNSSCLFREASRINLLIISPKVCRVCNTEGVVNFLKTKFPGLVVSYLYYPDAKANKLLKDFAIKGLPAYLLGREVEQEKNFDSLREKLEIKGDFYILKPQFSGFSYFLEREELKGKLDLFISLYDKDTPALLEMLREFNPDLHFLSVKQQDNFEAQKQTPEVEEYLRSVCVREYYPPAFWDYIICRAKSINSTWWEDCLAKLDTSKIKTCAQGEEGKRLLEENIRLNQELEIMFGPAYVLDNLEVFATRGVPKKEELKRLIQR